MDNGLCYTAVELDLSLGNSLHLHAQGGGEQDQNGQASLVAQYGVVVAPPYQGTRLGKKSQYSKSILFLFLKKRVWFCRRNTDLTSCSVPGHLVSMDGLYCGLGHTTF